MFSDPERLYESLDRDFASLTPKKEKKKIKGVNVYFHL